MLLLMFFFFFLKYVFGSSNYVTFVFYHSNLNLFFSVPHFKKDSFLCICYNYESKLLKISQKGLKRVFF